MRRRCLQVELPILLVAHHCGVVGIWAVCTARRSGPRAIQGLDVAVAATGLAILQGTFRRHMAVLCFFT
jgi:hypothetical protein